MKKLWVVSLGVFLSLLFLSPPIYAAKVGGTVTLHKDKDFSPLAEPYYFFSPTDKLYIKADTVDGVDFDIDGDNYNKAVATVKVKGKTLIKVKLRYNLEEGAFTRGPIKFKRVSEGPLSVSVDIRGKTDGTNLTFKQTKKGQVFKEEMRSIAAARFMALCRTCHGYLATGGRSWAEPELDVDIVPPPPDGEPAPEIGGGAFSKSKLIKTARKNAMIFEEGEQILMPPFHEDEISDEDLDLLARYITLLGTKTIPNEFTEPTAQHTVKILDDDPYFEVVGGPEPTNLLSIDPGDTVKWENHGRTWHTVTEPETGIDSGFIGPGTETDAKPAPQPGVVGGRTPRGVYYRTFENTPGGSHRLLCSLHPYMQMGVFVGEDVPATIDTRGLVLPLDPPADPGCGHLLVNCQYQDDLEPLKDDPEFAGRDGAIQVIDCATWGVIDTLEIGNNVHNMWANQIGGTDYVYTTSWHGVHVHKIDASLLTGLAEAAGSPRRAGAAPAHIMTTPDGKRLFASIMGSYYCQEFDPVTFTRETPGALFGGDGTGHQGGNGPHGVWMNEDSTRMSSADTISNTATLYNLDTNKPVWTVEVGVSPLASAINNDSGAGPGPDRVLIGNALSGTVSVLDIVDGDLLATIDLTEDLGASTLTSLDAIPGGPFLGILPIQLPVTPDGKYAVVANKGSGCVSILDVGGPNPNTKIADVPAGLGAHGVVFGEKGCDSGHFYAYVSNSFENYVSVYDMEVLDADYMDNEVVDNPGAIHVGDIPLDTTGLAPKNTYIKHPIGHLSVASDTGGNGVLTLPLLAPWEWED